jgi:DNA-binding transcriptional ArsR family regulator
MNLEFDQLHTEQASALLRAMGNSQRLRILLLLAERERSVIELEALVELSQSAVSQHLARLRQAKLVRFRRDGQMTFYALDGAEVQSILMTLHFLYGRDKSSAAVIPSPRSGRPMDVDPLDDPAGYHFRETST